MTSLPHLSNLEIPASQQPPSPIPGGLPLWLQLAAILLLLTVTIAYVGGEVTRRSESERLQARAKEQIEQRLALVKQRLFAALPPGTRQQLDSQPLDKWLNDFSLLSPDMMRLAVLDSQGQSVAHWQRPGIKAVFISGYVETPLAPPPGAPFLRKPFGGGELVREVYRAMAGERE